MFSVFYLSILSFDHSSPFYVLFLAVQGEHSPKSLWGLFRLAIKCHLRCYTKHFILDVLVCTPALKCLLCLATNTFLPAFFLIVVSFLGVLKNVYLIVDKVSFALLRKVFFLDVLVCASALKCF